MVAISLVAPKKFRSRRKGFQQGAVLPGSPLAAALEDTTPDVWRADGSHDAIVVGAGAAGGLAALLLTEAGLRVLVLDAGSPRLVRAPVHRVAGSLVRRFATPEGLAFLPPALVPKGRAALRLLGRWRQPIQSRCYAWEQGPEAFVDDFECPYVTPPDKPFIWIRSRQLGGRVKVVGHGRQYYRLSPDDFCPVDQSSPRWPLRPGELDPWYALVERRLKLSGRYDGLPWLPDSDIANVIEPTPSEGDLQRKIKDRWPSARAILSRFAPPLDSLEGAALTGRLSCRQGAIVREIMVDGSGNVRGVRWIDQQTARDEQASAPLVFLCASTLESTRLLLLSRSDRRPSGLGSLSGSLGYYLMDHVLLRADGVGQRALIEPAGEQGRCIYLPRFDARNLASPPSGRGFGVQLYQYPGARAQFYCVAVSFAEMLPRPENRVTLDPKLRDAWGIPVLRINCVHDRVEIVRARDQTLALREIAEVAGFKIHSINHEPVPPGSAAHECGTARMGTDPDHSMLDPYNQCWDARGLYVTDASCFPSQGSQNPTLTILALTARACDHARRYAMR